MKNIFLLVGFLVLAGCSKDAGKFVGTWEPIDNQNLGSVPMTIQPINVDGVFIVSVFRKGNAEPSIYRLKPSEKNKICGNFCLEYDSTKDQLINSSLGTHYERVGK
jgi:hypothetical protein